MDRAHLRRRKHRAFRFVCVRAIAELATRHELAQFGKRRPFNRFGIPQGEDLPTGRIGNISAVREREHLAGDGGVAPLFIAD